MLLVQFFALYYSMEIIIIISWVKQPTVLRREKEKGDEGRGCDEERA